MLVTSALFVKKKIIASRGLKMKINVIETFQAYLAVKCPDCGEKLRLAYLADPLLCCTKCGEVYEVHLKRSKLTIAQIKADGWLK
jgi:uncharacterized Zn finger protein